MTQKLVNPLTQAISKTISNTTSKNKFDKLEKSRTKLGIGRGEVSKFSFHKNRLTRGQHGQMNTDLVTLTFCAPYISLNHFLIRPPNQDFIGTPNVLFWKRTGLRLFIRWTYRRSVTSTNGTVMFSFYQSNIPWIFQQRPTVHGDNLNGWVVVNQQWVEFFDKLRRPNRKLASDKSEGGMGITFVARLFWNQSWQMKPELLSRVWK